MESAKELFSLSYEGLTLLESMEAAASVDREFKERFEAMLHGTGDPVTPEEAQRYSNVIKDAEANHPRQAKRLIEICLLLADIIKQLGPK